MQSTAEQSENCEKKDSEKAKKETNQHYINKTLETKTLFGPGQRVNDTENENTKNNNDTVAPVESQWSCNQTKFFFATVVNERYTVVAEKDVQRKITNDLQDAKSICRNDNNSMLPYNRSYPVFNFTGNNLNQCLYKILNKKKTCGTKPLNRQQKKSVFRNSTFCCKHNRRYVYWCRNCKEPKCILCVKNCQGSVCHHVTTIAYHAKEWKAKVQASSSACLRELDKNLGIIEKKEQEAQLQTLMKTDRIRQEFISFHELLIDQEKNILEHITKNFAQYLSENKQIRQIHSSLIEEEARIMCASLTLSDEHDVTGRMSESVEQRIDKQWTDLRKKIADMVYLFKSQGNIEDRFTMCHQKNILKAQLATVTETVDIVPVLFTRYLDEDDLIAPITVSDLWTCTNSHVCKSKVRLAVEIRCGNEKIWRGKRKMHNFLFNFGDQPYLQEYQRYVVTARPYSFFDDNSLAGQRCRNILIVTGRKKLMKEAEDEAMQYIENIRSGRIPSEGFFNRNHEQYHKWTNSELWKYSSFSGSKGFYNVSPEELRTIAYTTNNVFYNQCSSILNEDFRRHCTHQNEELVKFFEAVSMDLEGTNN